MRYCLAFVPFFILFCGVLFAQLQSAQLQDQPEPLKQSPALMKGTVVDQDGAAVEGSIVKLLVTTFDKPNQKWGQLLKQTVTTNEAGELEVSINKAPAGNVELYLNLSVESKIHFRQDFHFDNDKLWHEEVDLGSLKIAKGVRVTGQLASPDADMEMRRPVVMFSAASPDRSTYFHSDNCDAEGKFSCVVPAGCELELSIAAENFAFTNSKHQIDAPLSSNSQTEIAEVDLGKLTLERGVAVVGSAKLIDGSPASGVVIGIVEGDPESADGISHVSSAKTDAKGNFRLPPHLGKCRLYALKACRSRTIIDGDTQSLESDGKVPFINPVDLDLDGKVHELAVQLKEVRALTISGTVLDAQGVPMAGQAIGYGWGSQNGDFGIEGSIEMEYLKTKANGEYSFQFGKGRKLYFQIINSDLSNAGFEFFVTKKAAFVCRDLFPDVSSRLIEDLKFNPIVQDVTGLDWEVRRHRGSSLLRRTGEMVEWLLD